MQLYLRQSAQANYPFIAASSLGTLKRIACVDGDGNDHVLVQRLTEIVGPDPWI